MIRQHAAQRTAAKVSTVSSLTLAIVDLPQLAYLIVGTLLLLITILTLTATLSAKRARRNAAYQIILQLLSERRR